MTPIRKPQFCFIAPTAYLDMVSTERNTKHLVLAHLVDTDEVYADHYQQLSNRGDYIMMDNSAYELKEPYQPDKLIKLAKRCGASCIVLPDYPFAPAAKTIDGALTYAAMFKSAGFDTFFVPQSETGDLDDWIGGYQWASNNEHIDIIGLSILGIPNALPDINPAFARVTMIHHLMMMGIYSDKKHHALGLNSGPALEIPSMIAMNSIDSIDSSGPVWAGILGHEYTLGADSYQQVAKLKLPVNFNAPRTNDPATIVRIAHNIQLTEQLFDGNIVQNAWYAVE